MKLYADIKNIMRLSMKDDDRMNQETLFELQEEVCNLALRVAVVERKETDLVNAFPWCYQEVKP